MEEKNKIGLSKFLSYVLRHRPEKIGITLDKNGWTDTAILIEKAKTEVEFTLDELKEVVKNCDKQRFALSEDGTKIRANQGHSAKVDISFKEITAPPVLYHGTVKEAIEGIKKKGLQPMKRHHVHLSKDEATANIDTVTEQELEKILEKLPPKTSKVIIAHRLNTIQNADVIYFVSASKLSARLILPNTQVGELVIVP